MCRGTAPYVATWGIPEWWKPIAIILMIPAFLLAVIGLTTPNPTSVGQEGRVARSPEGIVRVTRHPFLIGVGMWAVVHLVANGDVASFIFFGAFAVTALAGTLSIDAKRRRALGPGWQAFAAQTSIVPFAAIVAGHTRFNPGEAMRCRRHRLRTDVGRPLSHRRRVPFSGVMGTSGRGPMLADRTEHEPRRDARRFGADACGHVALRRRRFSWGARHGRRGPRVTAVGAVAIGCN